MAVDVDELEAARRDPRVRDFLAAAGGYGEGTVPAHRSSGTASSLDPAPQEPVSIDAGELELARRDPRVRHLLGKVRDYGRAQATATESTSEEQRQPQAP